MMRQIASRSKCDKSTSSTDDNASHDGRPADGFVASKGECGSNYQPSSFIMILHTRGLNLSDLSIFRSTPASRCGTDDCTESRVGKIEGLEAGRRVVQTSFCTRGACQGQGGYQHALNLVVDILFSS